ncbi:MAG: N-acetylmuramoyl-L-alanine amidase [Eubacteriales bacterium]|nr:N-acetylmuramoyl-L-alanine amidase [Eubacteriales bacterium]
MYLVIDRKKCLLFCSVFLAAGLLLGGVLGVIPDRNTFGVEGGALKVIIDAGHGLPDGGAVGANGSIEADLNLDIAKMVAEVMQGKGIDTIMIRNDKEGIREEGSSSWSKIKDMRLRLEKLRKADADLFVSIHMNHFPMSDVSGLRLFYAANHKEIKPLAENIQLRMSELTGAKVTAVRAADKSLFLMKSPPIPAILIECGFISNPAEEKKLMNEEYRAKIAWAIADTIERYYLDDKNEKS